MGPKKRHQSGSSRPRGGTGLRATLPFLLCTSAWFQNFMAKKCIPLTNLQNLANLQNLQKTELWVFCTRDISPELEGWGARTTLRLARRQDHEVVLAGASVLCVRLLTAVATGLSPPSEGLLPTSPDLQNLRKVSVFYLNAWVATGRSAAPRPWKACRLAPCLRSELVVSQRPPPHSR